MKPIYCGWWGEGRGQCVLFDGHMGAHTFACLTCNGKGVVKGKRFNEMERCIECSGTGRAPSGGSEHG